jgi:hypothetical protein
MDKWNYKKLKSFCTTKEMVSKLKSRRKSSYTSDKGLIIRVQGAQELNSPQINEPIKKWATEVNRTFSKEEVQTVKKHMKKAHHPWP